MTFVDHFLNFVIYGSLFGICQMVLILVQSAAASRRERRRGAPRGDGAAGRPRRGVDRYPKKTSASA